MSGLTLFPESLVFAFLAGCPPQTGLITAFIMSLVAGFIGGRPGTINGVSGSMTFIAVKVVSDYGWDHLYMTIILMGIIQLLLGWLKIGKFIRLIPKSVTMGFVNGMVINVLIDRFHNFKIWEINEHSGFYSESGKVLTSGQHNSQWEYLQSTELFVFIGLIVLAILITNFFPKITKELPGGLISVSLVSFLVIGFGINTPMLIDYFPVKELPIIPHFYTNFELFGSLSTIMELLPYALAMAVIGLMQSLMNMTFLDYLTDSRGNGNSVSISQGVGNLLSGLFGGIAGTSLPGQSVINFKSGGRGRLSSITAAGTILLLVITAPFTLPYIPVAPLIGIIIFMVVATFSWTSVRILQSVRKSDALVLIAVSSITILSNVAFAVLAGIFISALAFAWENAMRIRVRKKISIEGAKHYEVYGPLFFASVSTFSSKFDYENDPDEIVINFLESRIWDHGGIESIIDIAHKYHDLGKNVKLIHLSRDTRFMLKKLGMAEDINIVTDPNDPVYHVVTDDPHIHE